MPSSHIRLGEGRHMHALPFPGQFLKACASMKEGKGCHRVCLPKMAEGRGKYRQWEKGRRRRPGRGEYNRPKRRSALSGSRIVVVHTQAMNGAMLRLHEGMCATM